MRVLMAVDDSGFAEDLLRAVVAGYGMRILRSWFCMCCDPYTLCRRLRWPGLRS